MKPKIVITGIGVYTPHGSDPQTVAGNLNEGRSAIRRVTRFDVSQFPAQIAAFLDEYPRPHSVSEEVFENANRPEKMNFFCITRALEDAGLWSNRGNLRIGMILGSASEWIWAWEDDFLQGRTPSPCDPTRDRPAMLDTLQKYLAIQGPRAMLSTACASGNHAMSQARRWLEFGWCDACLAGGSESAMVPLPMSSFGNLRALSRRNDAPEKASRPFDRDRDGFVLGEGGVVFLLEREADARRRGAKIHGEFVSCGMTSDAFHPVIPAPDPTQAIVSVRMALRDAGINPEEVGYVNAHGTSTPVGDIAETKALQAVFGDWTRSLPVSSTKSMTGHLLTVASMLEALVCLSVLKTGVIPPTINLDNPDPECNLNHVANVAREANVKIAISNSFGFGGSNSCAVFRGAE